VLVQTRVVGTHPPLIVVLLLDEYRVGQPFRVVDFLDKPAASSFASSFLMASRLSGENRRNRCFFGVALGSTFKACSINSLGTPGISTGFHANTSRLALRNLTSSSSYLSPMMAVLESSPSCSWIVLVPTPLVGLTDDWLGFLEGIDSLSESSLAAASISLTELGTRIVEA